MKKKFSALIGVLFALAFAFALSACGNNDQDPPSHVHDFSIMNASSEYLASPATCTEKARYYYLCSCGAVGTETFENGEPKGHTYSTNWWSDDTYHWHKAVCEHTTEIKDKEEHKFYEGVCECGYAIYISNLLDLHKTGGGYEVCGYNGKAEKVVIPKEYKGLPVVSIGAKAFRDEYTGHSNLKEIFIPDSVKTIGSEAFYNCDSLTTITLGKNIKEIGDSAFYNCTALTGVYINDLAAWFNIGFNSSDANPLSFAHNLYLNEELVTNLVIPSEITNIPNSVFYGCSSIKILVVGDNVSSIGGLSFYNCSGLTSVTIGKNVSSIDNYAFHGCSSLLSITMDENNGNYKSIDGNLYTKDGTTLLQYAIGKTETNFKIPNGVTSIGESAFHDCSGLTSVTIPDSVTSIGYYAFSGCIGLTSIDIPDSVTSIEYGTFYDCSGLMSVTIPDGVTSIGSEAFSGCIGLTSIDIPDSVTSIEYGTFYDCSGLMSITIPDSVTSIGNYAFSGCIGLTSIDIPYSVRRIGHLAFWVCSSLTSINFNGSTYQWNAIDKSSSWNVGTGDYTIYCSDGNISKN